MHNILLCIDIVLLEIIFFGHNSVELGVIKFRIICVKKMNL